MFQDTLINKEIYMEGKSLIREIGDSDFHREVIESDIPVVLEFSADWCGPCHILEPVLDEMASTMYGRVKFVKINVEENSITAAQHGIQFIPTVFYYHKGRLEGESVGLVSAKEIEERIKAIS